MYDEKQREIYQIRPYALLSRKNYEGADLRKVDFTGTILVKANLKRADLRGANFQRACLKEANLNEADLRGADLYWTDLRGANLEGMIIDDEEDKEYIMGGNNN